jgi:acetoin utilization deacetylase AcuC-like enzyme
LFDVDVHLGWAIEDINQQQHSVIFAKLNDLADKTIEGTAANAYVLPGGKGGCGFAYGAVNLADFEALYKSIRKHRGV